MYCKFVFYSLILVFFKIPTQHQTHNRGTPSQSIIHRYIHPRQSKQSNRRIDSKINRDLPTT